MKMLAKSPRDVNINRIIFREDIYRNEKKKVFSALNQPSVAKQPK